LFKGRPIGIDKENSELMFENVKMLDGKKIQLKPDELCQK
jgi:hypothetical protein